MLEIETPAIYCKNTKFFEGTEHIFANILND